MKKLLDNIESLKKNSTNAASLVGMLVEQVADLNDSLSDTNAKLTIRGAAERHLGDIAIIKEEFMANTSEQPGELQLEY